MSGITRARPVARGPSHCSSALVGALAPSVVAVVLHNAVIAGHWPIGITIAVDLLLVAGVVAWAKGRGVSRADLGLSRSSMRAGATAGLLVGLGVIAVVAVFFALGVLDGVNSDSTGTSQLWFRLLVGIPIGTALAEELIFRGGLLALWDRAVSARASTAAVSTLFGLWHVAVEAHRLGPGEAPWTVLPAVLATAAASAFVLCPLRRRTGSIVAPVIVHTATNAAVLIAVAI